MQSGLFSAHVQNLMFLFWVQDLVSCAGWPAPDTMLVVMSLSEWGLRDQFTLIELPWMLAKFLFRPKIENCRDLSFARARGTAEEDLEGVCVARASVSHLKADLTSLNGRTEQGNAERDSMDG